jgi:hypothetical protein
MNRLFGPDLKVFFVIGYTFGFRLHFLNQCCTAANGVKFEL